MIMVAVGTHPPRLQFSLQYPNRMVSVLTVSDRRVDDDGRKDLDKDSYYGALNRQFWHECG